MVVLILCVAKFLPVVVRAVRAATWHNFSDRACASPLCWPARGKGGRRFWFCRRSAWGLVILADCLMILHVFATRVSPENRALQNFLWRTFNGFRMLATICGPLVHRKLLRMAVVHMKCQGVILTSRPGSGPSIWMDGFEEFCRAASVGATRRLD